MPVHVRSLAEWDAAGVRDLLSVVIPAQNEEGHIEETVRGLVAALQEAGINHEILVVNDNSEDRTEDLLRWLHLELLSVRYINNPPPNGFGFAVRSGLAEFRGDAVAIVMADGSDRPEDLVAFTRSFGKVTIVCLVHASCEEAKLLTIRGRSGYSTGSAIFSFGCCSCCHTMT